MCFRTRAAAACCFAACSEAGRLNRWTVKPMSRRRGGRGGSRSSGAWPAKEQVGDEMCSQPMLDLLLLLWNKMRGNSYECIETLSSTKEWETLTAGTKIKKKNRSRQCMPLAHKCVGNRKADSLMAWDACNNADMPNTFSGVPKSIRVRCVLWLLGVLWLSGCGPACSGSTAYNAGSTCSR